jgi:molybdopterin/thiamine biosynthesis adenylyltransferase
MSDLTNRLSALTTPPNEMCKPVFYRIGDPASSALLSELLEQNPHLIIVDQILLQLKDLVKLENPERSLTEQEYSEKIAQKLGKTPIIEYGVWVHYPWKNQVVHMLDEEDFVRVRTIRNAYKITFEEQATLRTKKVGVIGLSVGQSVSLALAIERIAGEIRIADFDTLELSNLNRIRTGVHNLGTLKTVAVAREIAELDPFIKVVCFHEGITKENIDSFFDEGGRLDLLVEECDAVEIKILARQEAKKRKLPVVMDTSDRGMLDIERFDLDPEYPILHGLVDSSVSYEFLSSLKSSEERLPYALPIIGIDSISTRFRSSLLEVGQTITTWPQLASDVNIGGSICARIVCKILLSKNVISRRYWFDIEDKFEKELFPRSISIHDDRLHDSQIDAIATNLHSNKVNYKVPFSEVEDMVKSANLSSSPGNAQRWKWLYSDDVLYLLLDKKSERGFSDNFSFGSMLGFGMTLEHLRISASTKGLNAKIKYLNELNEPRLIASVTFEKANTINREDVELCAQIAKRTTNRKLIERVDIESNILEDLLSEVQNSKFKYLVFSDSEKINQIGKLIRMGDRIRLTNPYGHNDFFKNEIRWSKSENDFHRDGIDIETLNLTHKDILGLQLAKDELGIEFLNQFNGGKGFEKISEKTISASSALVIISIPKYDKIDLLEVGRIIGRIWLKATSLKIGFQPMTVLQMLFSYLHTDKYAYISEQQKTEISEIKSMFDSFCPELKTEQTIFTFRLFPSADVENKTLRKSVSDTIIVK